MRRMMLLLALFFCALLARPAIGETESILALSDTHLTRDAQKHAEMMEAVVQAAAGRDAVLMIGDNTDNAHAEEHALVLKWAGEIERRTGAEVYIIPGNHDYGAFFGPEKYIAMYGAYGREGAFSLDMGTASCAVMTKKGTCLLLLDTNQPDTDRSFLPDGRLGEETVKWVRQVLASLPEGTPVVVCGHHPILPEERDKRTPGAEALGLALREYGAGIYLCGHDHGFATVEQDGLRQITVGQPQSYPGWAGILEREEEHYSWHTERIYAEESQAYQRLMNAAESLGRNMARGTLEPTPYAGDEGAIDWFAEVFMLTLESKATPEDRVRLLADENCLKWRQVETPTVVKKWILGLLEDPPEDVSQIKLPPSRKHSMN